MINKKSVATAYDEHLTLVEWLQEVKKALDNAVLTGITMEQVEVTDNTATYQIVAKFADDTEVTSDPFDLPSPNITEAFDGLTNLVTTFDNRITINKNNITTNTNNIGSIMDIIDIANDQINAYTLQNSINGSDDIIVDVDETNEKLVIRLSAELQAKLGRVLLTPLLAPSTRKVVTIDTNGAQDNVDGTELTTLMGNIVDSHGNARFVEGDLTLRAPFADLGVTMLYGKWSLSGSHLMFVLALNIPSGVTTPRNTTISIVTLPSYIADKLVGLWTTVIDIKNFDVRNSQSWYQNVLSLSNVKLVRSPSGNTIYIDASDSITTEVDSICRIQFDLIVDSE